MKRSVRGSRKRPRCAGPARAALALALLLVGCPHGETTRPVERPGAGGGSEDGAEGPGPYAVHPLTPLAREVTALAWAALRGEELPHGDLRLASTSGRVEGLPDGELAGALSPVAFLARMDAGPGGQGGRWLKLAVLLSSDGLCVIQVEPRSAPSHPQPTGPARPGLLATAREVVAAVQGEAGVSPVPAPLAPITRGLPPIDRAAVAGMAADAVTAASLDDLALVARSGATLYLLEVTVDHDERGVVLGTDPFLRVHRIPAEAAGGQEEGDDPAPPDGEAAP